MADEKKRTPLTAEYVNKQHRAAMKALADVNRRRKWPDSESGSPVAVMVLCEEIARLHIEPAVLWCCHVRGPDDVHAAPDYATALKWADMTSALNWRGRGGKNEPPASFDDCLLKAVPAIWPWSAEQHAENLPKSIRDFTPRNQLPPDDPDYRVLTAGNADE